jgi:hypothetical protein
MKYIHKFLSAKYLNIILIMVYTLLFISIVVLTFFIVYNSNWLLGDQVQFLRTTAIDKVLPIGNYIMPTIGRFFPLGLMDYNLLLLFPQGNTATAHYILNAVSFIIFITAFFLLLHKILGSKYYNVINVWIVLCTILFLSQRVYSIYLDVIFPERMVVMLLALFILSTWQFLNTDKWIYGISALFFALYLVYCKEPLFGALLVFALTNLILNWRNLTFNNRLFFGLLVINSFIFIVLYYSLVYVGIESAYSGNHGENDWIKMSLKMIRSNKIIVIAIILFFPRIYAIFFRMDRRHLFFDGLLFSGIAYFIACLLLQLNYAYNYLPAIILITPAIIFWLKHYTKPSGVSLVFTLFAVFYLAKFPSLIKNNQQLRKNTYPQVEQIANYAQTGYQLLWYKPYPENNSWNNVMRDWKKLSLQGYIAFVLKDEQFKFGILNHPPTVIDAKTLVLYPSENDLINVNSANLFMSKTQHFRKDTIAQIEDIRVIKIFE